MQNKEADSIKFPRRSINTFTSMVFIKFRISNVSRSFPQSGYARSITFTARGQRHGRRKTNDERIIDSSLEWKLTDQQRSDLNLNISRRDDRLSTFWNITCYLEMDLKYVFLRLSLDLIPRALEICGKQFCFKLSLTRLTLEYV